MVIREILFIKQATTILLYDYSFRDIELNRLELSMERYLFSIGLRRGIEGQLLTRRNQQMDE